MSVSRTGNIRYVETECLASERLEDVVDDRLLEERHLDHLHVRERRDQLELDSHVADERDLSKRYSQKMFIWSASERAQVGERRGESRADSRPRAR